jgi:hypothetical protein
MVTHIFVMIQKTSLEEPSIVYQHMSGTLSSWHLCSGRSSALLSLLWTKGRCDRQMARKQRNMQMWVDPADHQMAKILATTQGMTLKQYFRRKVEDDVQKLPDQLLKGMFRRGGGMF